MNDKQTNVDSSLQQAIQRPQLYWNRDGIPETVMGALWIVWGAVLFLPVLFPHSGAVKMQAAILVVAMGIFPAFMGRFIRGWKERVTFPRSGYVELRKPGSTAWVAMIAIGVVVAFVFFMIVRKSGPSIREWLPATMAVVISLSLLNMGWKMQSKRLMALSPLVALAAFATLPLGGGEISAGAGLLSAGVVCVTDGGLRLREYKQQHPWPAEEH